MSFLSKISRGAMRAATTVAIASKEDHQRVRRALDREEEEENRFPTHTCRICGRGSFDGYPRECCGEMQTK